MKAKILLLTTTMLEHMDLGPKDLVTETQKWADCPGTQQAPVVLGQAGGPLRKGRADRVCVSHAPSCFLLEEGQSGDECAQVFSPIL